MRIKIVHKLFAALVLITLVAILLIIVVAQWSIKGGFRDYLWNGQLQRLATIQSPLLAHYQRVGDWSQLQGDPKQLHRLLEQGYRQQYSDEPRPPPGAGAGPPHRAPANARHRNGHRPPHEGTSNPILRTTLLDQQQQLVAGRPGPRQRLLPLLLDGQTVGYLALAEPHLSAPEDLSFISQQRKMLLAAAGVTLLLAIVAALYLSRQLSAPLLRITNAMRRAATGAFDTRVSVTSRDEIGQLAVDFNHLATALQRNENLRRQLTADIAHELRTPVAILRGELEALQEGIRPLEPSALTSLAEETRRLDSLINDLQTLALSDCGALTYQMAPLPLYELVSEVCQHYQVRAQRLDLNLSLSCENKEVVVTADATRLRQLLSNLLENSLRYTDAPGQIAVDLQTDGSQVTITVADSAPCPPSATLEHLFDRFYRPDAARSRQHGGAGLGLAICANIATAHNTTLHAQPAALGGLAIRFSLPITRS